MEIYGLDYPNSLSHSKCRVDVLNIRQPGGWLGAKVSHEEKTHLVARSVTTYSPPKVNVSMLRHMIIFCIELLLLFVFVFDEFLALGAMEHCSIHTHGRHTSLNIPFLCLDLCI